MAAAAVNNITAKKSLERLDVKIQPTQRPVLIKREQKQNEVLVHTE